MTERIAVPVVNLIPRPDGVEAWQAALLEPIAVGLNTVDRLRLLLGETVVVLGQGPIGLALTRLCALSGAGRLIVTDAREAPFAVSRPTAPATASTSRRPTPTQALADLTERRGRRHRDRDLRLPGVVGDGASTCVRKEGKVAHIGWANDLPPLPVIPIMAKTLTVFGVGGNGGRGQYERAPELVRTGRLDLAPMVTHRFSLDDVAEAFASRRPSPAARSRWSWSRRLARWPIHRPSCSTPPPGARCDGLRLHRHHLPPRGRHRARCGSRSTGPRCATRSARAPSTSSTARSTTRARRPDVGCVLLTGNGPSPARRRLGVLLRRRPAHPRAHRLPVRLAARPPTPSTRRAPGGCTSWSASG